MTKHNYIPGKAYKMRNGEKAVFIGENPFDLHYPLVFVHQDNYIAKHRYNGSYAATHNKAHHLDIIGEWPPEPRKVKGWVNVYSSWEKELIHPDKPTADGEAGAARIACIPIEFTEGEGL